MVPRSEDEAQRRRTQMHAAIGDRIGDAEIQHFEHVEFAHHDSQVLATTGGR